MGTVLIVDGADVCRAPIVEFVLRQQLTDADEAGLGAIEVLSRGLEAEPDATMCDLASTRLGFSGPSIAFYGAHRAMPLQVADIAGAELVLTAERLQRSSVVRMLPGTQARVFTWREALVLATVFVDRVASGIASPVHDLPGLARALHSARGTVPLIEPTVRTGAFHWRRAAETDPLTVPDGHDGGALHKHTTQESADIARGLAARFAEATVEPVPLPETIGEAPEPVEPDRRDHWWRRRA